MSKNIDEILESNGWTSRDYYYATEKAYIPEINTSTIREIYTKDITVDQLQTLRHAGIKLVPIAYILVQSDTYIAVYKDTFNSTLIKE